MEVDDDNPHQINFYIETWFDVDRKFDLSINAEDGTCLMLYGKYDPYADDLQIECEISRIEAAARISTIPQRGTKQSSLKTCWPRNYNTSIIRRRKSFANNTPTRNKSWEDE